MILINVDIYAPTTWHNVTGIIARILFHTFHTKHSKSAFENKTISRIQQSIKPTWS